VLSLSCAGLVVTVALLTGCGSAAHQGTPTHTTKTARVVTRPLPHAKVARVVIPSGAGNLAAMAGPHGMVLRDRPHGRVIAHLLPSTSYGSPTVVWAEKQRGDWLGVVATSVPNNHLGWLDVQRDRPQLWRSRYTLIAHLSTRTLVVVRGRRRLRTIPVTIGHPETPTPIGRFEVTDKLLPPKNSAYGCCILALSGHQPILRPGWAGGDRIAIHGSPAQLVGAAASAGCLRARDRDLRYLMRLIPLGTPVYIRL
jgi:hypothetical protein